MTDIPNFLHDFSVLHCAAGLRFSSVEQNFTSEATIS